MISIDTLAVQLTAMNKARMSFYLTNQVAERIKSCSQGG